MKIHNTKGKQWFIHFYSDMCSMPLYKDYESIRELCEVEQINRKDFEIYSNVK